MERIGGPAEEGLSRIVPKPSSLCVQLPVGLRVPGQAASHGALPSAVNLAAKPPPEDFSGASYRIVALAPKPVLREK